MGKSYLIKLKASVSKTHLQIKDNVVIKKGQMIRH